MAREFWHNLRLWFQAVRLEPFYRYGELGNIFFNIGKSILEGVVLYTMFTMAESEYKVAAIMGVLTKYIYPGIVVVSNARISAFIDYLEKFSDTYQQIRKLIRGLVYVGAGEAVGALFLVLCFPPLFETLFGGVGVGKYVLILLYLLHHLCSGAAQISEGRIWFRIIEIKIRKGRQRDVAGNFWGIHAMSQNIHLILSMVFLWSTTAVTGFYFDRLDSGLIIALITVGLILALVAKFTLPVAWVLNRKKEEFAR